VRLFVALAISTEVQENFAALIQELRKIEPPSTGNRTRWVKPENLHVTLKFIGEVPVEKGDAIRATLRQVRSSQYLELRFRGLGFFPSERRPRVLWVGMETSSNLAPVAAEIEARLDQLGIPGEKRQFTPHLTLARFAPPGISDQLRRPLNENARREFGTVHAREFYLMQSKLKPTGAEYTCLEAFPFVAEA
jgi:2'-5' RNA ligase